VRSGPQTQHRNWDKTNINIQIPHFIFEIFIRSLLWDSWKETLTRREGKRERTICSPDLLENNIFNIFIFGLERDNKLSWFAVFSVVLFKNTYLILCTLEVIEIHETQFWESKQLPGGTVRLHGSSPLVLCGLKKWDQLQSGIQG